MQLVPLVHRRRVAEDVVDAALNVRMDIILPAIIGEQRVLVAEKAAVLEDGAIAAIGHRDRLPGIARCVLKCNIVRLEARPVDLDRLGKEGASGSAGVQRIRNDHIFGDLPIPSSVTLLWFCVTMTRSL